MGKAFFDLTIPEKAQPDTSKLVSSLVSPIDLLSLEPVKIETIVAKLYIRKYRRFLVKVEDLLKAFPLYPTDYLRQQYRKLLVELGINVELKKYSRTAIEFQLLNLSIQLKSWINSPPKSSFLIPLSPHLYDY